MYIGFLHLHSTFRWLLLLSLIFAIVKYMAAWLGNQPWKKSDNFLGISIVWLIDLQLVTGLTLYFFLSPITQIALSNFGAAMKDASLRFYSVEHLSVMVLTVILVHIGRAKSKRAKSDSAKFKIAAIFYLVSLILIIAAIPWSRLQN